MPYKCCNTHNLFSGELYLEMTKSEEVAGFFDDGLVFVFKDEAGELKPVKPMHIHLEV